MTIRAVLDANVFVSAAIQRGAWYRIIQRWLAGSGFELIVSDGVLAEVEDWRASVDGSWQVSGSAEGKGSSG